MTKLKINKSFIKKNRNQNNYTKMKTPKIKRTNMYFQEEDREKKKKVTDDKLPICH